MKIHIAFFECVKFVHVYYTEISREAEAEEIYFKTLANVLWELASVKSVGQPGREGTLN